MARWQTNKTSRLAEIVTLDSSVIVAALRKEEAQNDASRSLLEKVKDGTYAAIEPQTVLIEVAAAIRRRTGSQKLSARITKDLQAMDTIHFQDLDSARAARRRTHRFAPTLRRSMRLY